MRFRAVFCLFPLPVGALPEADDRIVAELLDPGVFPGAGGKAGNGRLHLARVVKSKTKRICADQGFRRGIRANNQCQDCDECSGHSRA